MHYPDWFLDLLPFWEKLPGIGPRSAERLLLDLLSWEKEELLAFSDSLKAFGEKRHFCPTCGALAPSDSCPFCEGQRDRTVLCIIGGQKQLHQIERTGTFKGLYHVLDTLLTFEDDPVIDYHVDKLKNRLDQHPIEEIIFALEGTLDGDATCHLLRERLSPAPYRLTRLAFGLPIGTSFTSVDGGTLSRSLLSRVPL